MADQQQSSAYEAVLGMFLVRFNRIEYLLSVIIRRELRLARLGYLGEQLAKGLFKSKVDYFYLIAKERSDYENSLRPRLEALGARRNTLAHGHVETDPSDETLALYGSKGVQPVDIAAVEADMAEATELIEALERLNATQWLDRD